MGLQFTKINFLNYHVPPFKREEAFLRSEKFQEDLVISYPKNKESEKQGNKNE